LHSINYLPDQRFAQAKKFKGRTKRCTVGQLVSVNRFNLLADRIGGHDFIIVVVASVIENLEVQE
jgi:hypothetical protein